MPTALASVTYFTSRQSRALGAALVLLGAAGCSSQSSGEIAPGPQSMGGAVSGSAGTAGTAGAPNTGGVDGGDVSGTSGGMGGGGAGGNAAGAAGNMNGGGMSGGGMSGGGASMAGGAGGNTSPDPNAPAPSKGCARADALAEGPHDIKVGQLVRSYILRKPQAYAASAAKAWPLVLALHPNGSKADYWDGTTGSRAIRPLLADKAVLASAQARNDDWRGDVPLDLEYFEALITELESKLCVDTRRIFAMGFSGGGSFSGALGCYRSDIRAFAAGGAVIYFEPAKCTGKPASWITIGDDEAVQGRLDYRDFFRTFAGCTAASTPAEPAPCVAYACPDPQRPVTFCSHPGGHVWPDFGSKAALDFFWQF